MSEPLDRVTSIKVKLGLLVAASVVVAAVLATLGAGSVPPLLSIPVTVLLAIGVTQLLAVGMTAPLRQMTMAVRRMAAGDYAVRVDTTSADEVGDLARAFNRMAADLATVDRQRRDLVATVSHELRTPLAGLVALLENVADGVTRPEPATVRVALAQAQRLSDLVEDLLDLSRVEAGAASMDAQPVALRELVETVVEEATSPSRDVGIELVVPEGLVVDADPRRLQQLFVNLLDNAVRHSPDGALIRVVAGEAGGWAWLEVTDGGPGIPPADRERVFERYGTADTHAGGTGLGLAIARWVAELHGGRIEAIEPGAGERGARLRVELPSRAQQQTPPPTDRTIEGRTPMATAAPLPPTSVPAGKPLTDSLFGSFWPERSARGRPLVIFGALAVGVFFGATLPMDPHGLAMTLSLLGAGAVVAVLTPHRRDPFTWACGALAAAFAVLFSLRAAEWVVVLGMLIALVLVAAGTTRPRSVLGFVLTGIAWPLSGLRGLPWLGRSLRLLTGGRGNGLAVVRTVVLAGLGLLVFGALFASADAVFGEWIGAVVPDIGSDLVLRVFLAVAVTGLVLTAAYLSLNPPDVEPGLERRPVARRYEWLVPVLVVDAVFLVFLVAQAAAFLGGHDYVRRTTGLTYADYVHQGFAQLTIATLLTVLVVWAAASKARLRDPADRAWLRASCGALCLLTLVVVASALHRMSLYQDAYGFTSLRLVVDVFELWLGVVVLAMLVAGVRLRGWWLPRMALLSGAAMFLALAMVNPDAWVARHNLERYDATGKVDWQYLRGLSADATPTILAQAPEEGACALRDTRLPDESWTGWNLARERARDALAAESVARDARCPVGGTNPSR